MTDELDFGELDEKPQPATRGQLNNVELVRAPYFQELARLPELERGMEVVKVLVMLKDLSKGTKLERKLEAAMKAMSTTV